MSDHDDATGDLEPIPLAATEGVVRERRRPMGSLIAAAGVAALVLVGAFAVSAVVGGSGGSNSAEGAVRKLADALSHEDPLAAADVMAPSEVRSLHGTLDAAAQKAQELQLVSNSGAPLSGVDFNVNDLKLSSQTLGDGYVKVTVDAGTFSASTQKAKFSALMQKVLRDTDDNSAQSDLSKLFADHNVPTFLVVVRQDGNWYVSAAYTVLEYEREIGQLPAADFGSGQRNIALLGADSPDAAVQDSMHALEHNDWSKLMGMVSPTEIPLYDYRDAMNALIHKTDGGPETNFTIDKMSTNAQVDGDTAKVTLTASGKSGSRKWSIDGGCFTAPGDAIPISCDGGAFLGFFVSPADSLSPGSQFTVTKVDGRWFLSPVGTVLDVVDQWIKTIDRRALFTMIGIANQLPPDGALTLGKPVTLNAGNERIQILSFDGHKGEKLLGLAKQATAPSENDFSSTDVVVFRPDGSTLDDGSGLLYGQNLELPADGRYTFVLRTFAIGSTGDATVTIWNEADAPAAARDGSSFPSSSCTYTGTSTDCLTGPGPSGQSGSGSGSATFDPSSDPFCTAAGRAAIAKGELPGPDGKPELDQHGVPITVPSGMDLNNFCVPPDVGGPGATVVVPTSLAGAEANRSGSVSSSETSSVPHG